ncbi:hypothetical protein Tco_0991787 [Tanacetum coccineum]|uniref:Uncharacterized protein n=1 Tax=Tanacetum coccineum TaxID=301880 RepID=A0ABQ5F104_9ASTR
MTKITNLEASFEQYKAEQAAILVDANQHRSLLQEIVDKNKVESDQQFAEIMGVLKNPIASNHRSDQHHYTTALSRRDHHSTTVYQAERFFDIQGLFTTGKRLRAAMMCLEGPALSCSLWLLKYILEYYLDILKKRCHQWQDIGGMDAGHNK